MPRSKSVADSKKDRDYSSVFAGGGPATDGLRESYEGKRKEKSGVRYDQLQMLKDKIEKLEKWKRDKVHSARMELSKLDRVHRDLESKGRLVLKEQEDKIKKLDSSQKEELQSYRQELAKLQETVSEEKTELMEKLRLAKELQATYEEKRSNVEREQRLFQEQLDVEHERLAELELEQDQKQKAFEAEIDRRRVQFQEVRKETVGKIGILDAELQQQQEKHQSEIHRLQQELVEVQDEVSRKQERAREEINKLLLVKEDLVAQKEKAEQKIVEIKMEEAERISEIQKEHQAQYVDICKEYEEEAKPREEELDRIRSMVRDREVELDRYTDEKEEHFQESIRLVNQRLKEFDEQILALKGQNRQELREREEVLQEHLLQLEDQVQQKLQENEHFENDFLAEEAMLQLQLDALIENDRVCSAEDPERKRQFEKRLQRLTEEATQAKVQGDIELEKYNTMKISLETELSRQKKKLVAKTKNFTTRINELGDHLGHLKVEVRIKKEALRDVDDRAQERLETLKEGIESEKESLTQELTFLKSSFCELANKLQLQRKEKSAVIESLERECQEQRRVLEGDVEKLQDLITTLRCQGEKVHNSLEMEWKDLVATSQALREKYDVEISNLESHISDKIGGEVNQLHKYRQLLSRYEHLKAILPKRQDELEDLQRHSTAYHEGESYGSSDDDSSNSDGKFAVSDEIEEMTIKIRRQSEILQDEDDPVFQNGGLVHRIYLEKSRRDQLLKDYTRQKQNLENELNNVEGKDDGMDYLKRVIVAEVSENDILQKEIYDLELALHTQGTGSASTTSGPSRNRNSENALLSAEGSTDHTSETGSAPKSQKEVLVEEMTNVNLELEGKEAELEMQISLVSGKQAKTIEVQEKIQNLQRQVEENRKMYTPRPKTSHKSVADLKSERRNKQQNLDEIDSQRPISTATDDPDSL